MYGIVISAQTVLDLAKFYGVDCTHGPENDEDIRAIHYIGGGFNGVSIYENNNTGENSFLVGYEVIDVTYENSACNGFFKVNDIFISGNINNIDPNSDEILDQFIKSHDLNEASHYIKEYD